MCDTTHDPPSPDAYACQALFQAVSTNRSISNVQHSLAACLCVPMHKTLSEIARVTLKVDSMFPACRETPVSSVKHAKASDLAC